MFSLSLSDHEQLYSCFQMVNNSCQQKTSKKVTYVACFCNVCNKVYVFNYKFSEIVHVNNRPGRGVGNKYSYTYSFCLEKLQIPEIDLGFLISATAVSASDTFQRIKDTINVIVEEYGVSHIRYGLVVYAREAVERLSFGQESADIDSLKAAVLNIQRPSGDPNLQGALEAAQKLFDSKPARPGVRKVLVVITDQKSTSRQEDVKRALIPLEEEDVKIVTVAVGSSADPLELERIASNKGYQTEAKRDMDPDTTAEKIMDKVLKGIRVV